MAQHIFYGRETAALRRNSVDGKVGRLSRHLILSMGLSADRLAQPDEFQSAKAPAEQHGQPQALLTSSG